MHSVLCKLIEERVGDCNVNITFLAHSGATIGYKIDGSIDTHYEERLHGEVPTFYPTIVQQIEEFDGLGLDHDAVDVVLLDAGINDVSILTILNPLMGTSQIEALVETYCHQHIVLLLERLTTTFKNATIILVGYYQIITEESGEELIHILLKALDLIPGGFLIDKLVDHLEEPLKRRVINNCACFARSSFAAFEQSASETNERLSATRVIIVPPPIEAHHAALSDDPWLFGIREDLTPEDAVALIRAEACENADFGRTFPVACEKASICHPNSKGARAYAEAILSLILREGNLSAML
jgi:hypothetical protein